MAETLKFKDRDKLYASEVEFNESSVVYGANGHYAVGGYYDVLGNSYNKKENITAAENAQPAKDYVNLPDEVKLAKGLI